MNTTAIIKQQVIRIGLGLLVSGVMLLCVLKVQAIGDDRYITKKEFAAYIQAHQDWGAEVIKRLEHEIEDDRKARSELRDEIKQLRQELQQRRPPPMRYEEQEKP